MTEKHLERALHLMEHRPQLAAKELRLALSDDPNSAYLHGLLALCCLDYGNKEEAFNEARQSIAADPTEPLGFQILAHYHLHEGNLLEAEVAIDEAIELNPEEPHYWGVLSNIELENNDLDRALEAAESGLRCDPTHIHCHNLRALILTRLGDSAQAKDSMDTALSINPDHALTHAYRGWTLLEKHLYPESRVHFREALRLDPTLEWARLGLIKALQQQNWAYEWHKKLRSKLGFVAVVVWFALNFHLIGIVNNAPGILHIALALFSFVSWTLLLGLACFAFLPFDLFAGPLLRFRMQFDADAKWVLTPQEQIFNKHATAFLLCGLLSVTLGIVTGFWWIFIAVASIYVATLPIGYAEDSRRKWTVWATHAVAAVAVGSLIFLVSTGKGSPSPGILYGLAAFNSAKFLLFPTLLKGLGGASVMKALVSAPALKGLAAMLGLGGAGALQALKDKEKQKIRTKMLSDASSEKKK